MLFQDWILFLMSANSLLLIIIVVILRKISILYKDFIGHHYSFVNSIMKETTKEIKSKIVNDINRNC